MSISIPKERDTCTQSNYYDAPITHMKLRLLPDFETKSVHSLVHLHIEPKTEIKEIVLDTRDITVCAAELVESGSTTQLEWEEGPKHAAYGTPLKLPLPNGASKGSRLLIRIEYETSPDASALQWLDPSQTAGKQHPYMFTQCQAIHARSFVPCQDTPAIKHTYSAEVIVHPPLKALMSAVLTGSDKADVEGTEMNVCRFEQKVPISSYLLALVVGDLESREVGPRSAVWSEPSMVDAGAKEFAETEKFLQAAESFLPPYRWGRYDILLLPPSFPYGGMENPCLTFVTPTLIAGDRSLVNVVAHEAAHSWSGNLVTNATWSDFWLNEGFTVFIERRICSKLYGFELSELDAYVGWCDMRDDIKRYGEDHRFTALHIEYQDVDPDDSFSSIPYEKGYNLLRHLEKVVGGPENFEPWLKQYFSDFEYQSITVADMKEHFLKFFREAGNVDQGKLDAIAWDKWILAVGMPPEQPDISMDLLQEIDRLVSKWLSETDADWLSANANDVSDYNTKQKIVFLEKLIDRAPLDGQRVSRLGDVYGFATTKNAELLFRFLTLAIRSKEFGFAEQAFEMLRTQGRMKFTRPLFRDLFNCGDANVKQQTVDFFKEHKDSYHSICQKMVARDLQVEDSH
eukprot:Clim_evm25s77 gene=Clim_evmTU25s77